MPRISDRGRLTAGLATLAFVLSILIIQVTSAFPAAASSLFVQPTGIAGLPATVTGSGFEDERVTLCWDHDGCSNLGQITPVLGTFTTAITVPADTTAGQHLVYACQSGSCSSAAIEVIGSDTTTTITPTTTETTTTTPTPTTTPSPTTSTPTASSTSPQTTTTTRSSLTTTAPGNTTTSLPSPFPTSPEPGTTIVGPGPGGTPTTSLPFVTETTTQTGEEDQDQGEEETLLGGGSNGGPPPTSILDSVMSGVFTIDPESSPEDEVIVAPFDAATPVPQSSEVAEAQDEPSSNKRPTADFPIPDLGMWAIWLGVTVVYSVFALSFDAVRQRRNR